VSVYLVVLVSVLAAATATLTLNLLARLDWRQARAWTRPAAPDAPTDAEGLPEPRQGPCGCLTVTGAIALLHEQALTAASRTHRATLTNHPTADPTAQPEVFELVYPLLDPSPAQHPAPSRVTGQSMGQEMRPAAERPGQEW
jgi:hypothetical protein